MNVSAGRAESLSIGHRQSIATRNQRATRAIRSRIDSAGYVLLQGYRKKRISWYVTAIRQGDKMWSSSRPMIHLPPTPEVWPRQHFMSVYCNGISMEPPSFCRSRAASYEANVLYEEPDMRMDMSLISGRHSTQAHTHSATSGDTNSLRKSLHMLQYV